MTILDELLRERFGPIAALERERHRPRRPTPPTPVEVLVARQCVLLGVDRAEIQLTDRLRAAALAREHRLAAAIRRHSR